MGKGRPHEDLPASDDPFWAELGREILEELDTPKPVSALKQWARDQKLEMARLINALSWLDMRKMVMVDKTQSPALWVRASPKTPRARVELPRTCPRCSGMLKVEPNRLACMVCGRSIYPPPDYELD